MRGKKKVRTKRSDLNELLNSNLTIFFYPIFKIEYEYKDEILPIGQYQGRVISKLLFLNY